MIHKSKATLSILIFLIVFFLGIVLIFKAQNLAIEEYFNDGAYVYTPDAMHFSAIKWFLIGGMLSFLSGMGVVAITALTCLKPKK